MFRTAAALIALLGASPALAHTGHGDVSGFSHGFLHPVGGLDHVLAMVAVGLFAAHLGDRALWLVPASFVAMMLAGGALGMGGIALPYTETAIALSVVALGLAVALRLRAPTAVAMTTVGAFAVFHGFAHGLEAPASASGLTYAAGFALATAALHACGIGAGLGLARLGETASRRIAQIGGGAMTAAGLALLSGVA